MVVCDLNRPAIELIARQRALPIAVVQALLVNYDASAADLQRVRRVNVISRLYRLGCGI